MQNTFSKQQKNLINFTLILGSVVVNSALSMINPVLTEIMREFFVEEAVALQAIGAGFYGTACAGLVYGPLADAIGRRRVLLIGMFIFLVGSIWCYGAHTITALLIARFVQGVGLVASSIIWLTIVKDIYKGKEAVKTLGVFATSISLSLAMAPIIGGKIAVHFGWRGIFLALIFMSVVQIILVYLNIPETLPAAKRKPIKLPVIIKNYLKVLSTPYFVKCGIVNGLTMGAYSGFIAIIGMYYIQELGMEKDAFSLHQFMMVLTYSLAAMGSQVYVKAFDTGPTLRLGLFITVVHGVLFGMLAYSGAPVLITGAYCLFSVASPFITSVVTSKGMEVFPRLRGMASAALTTLRQLTSAFVVTLFGFIYNETITSVVCTQIAMCVIILGLATWVIRSSISDSEGN